MEQAIRPRTYFAAKRKKKKMARIAGANYTDEAGLKHTYTLVAVDRDGICGDSI